MQLKTKFLLTVALAAAVFPARAFSAAAPDDLKSVLARLNVAAGKFTSAAADIEFDTIETDPVPDTDVQTGVVYYERRNGSVSMGAHFNTHNGKPSGKAYTFIGGVFRLFEPGVNQVTTHAGAAKFEDYIILGMGASGRDLEAKWNIRYLGSQELSDGKNMVKTAQLELIAKDPAVRKTVSKVVIWVDPDRGVSLKQVFTLSSSSTWVGRYSNFRLNQTLPSDAFTFKTNRQTVYQNQ